MKSLPFIDNIHMKGEPQIYDIGLGSRFDFITKNGKLVICFLRIDNSRKSIIRTILHFSVTLCSYYSHDDFYFILI